MNPPTIHLSHNFKLPISPSFSLSVPSPLMLSGPAMIGVAGPNGAGKSTLLRVIAHLMEGPAAQTVQKTILCHPNPVSWMPTQTQAAFDIQVEELVLLGRYPLHKGYPSAADRKICADMLAKLNISHLSKRSYQNLSSGEQRKASLARTLVAERSIILLDEPFSHLDPKASLDMMQVLLQQKKDGKLLVLSIHDLNMAMRVCDQLIFLKQGAVSTKALSPAEVKPDLLQEIYEVEFRVFPGPTAEDALPFLIPQSYLDS